MATAANAAPSISVDRQFDFRDADFSRVRKMIHERAGISLGAHKREMVYSRLARGCAPGAAGFRQLPGPAGAPARRARVGRLHQCADHQPDGLLPRIASLSDPGRFRAQPRRPGIDLVLRGLDRRGTVFHRHHAGRSAGPARLVVHGAGHGHRHQCAQPRRGLSGRARGEDGGVAAQALLPERARRQCRPGAGAARDRGHGALRHLEPAGAILAHQRSSTPSSVAT